MKDTCKKEGCYWWDLCGDKCPDYIQTWWKAPDKEAILVTDCARVRVFLMIQELHNRFTGVEKSQEEMRNEAAWIQVVAEVLGRRMGIAIPHKQDYKETRKLFDNMKISGAENGKQ